MLWKIWKISDHFNKIVGSLLCASWRLSSPPSPAIFARFSCKLDPLRFSSPITVLLSPTSKFFHPSFSSSDVNHLQLCVQFLYQLVPIIPIFYKLCKLLRMHGKNKICRISGARDSYTTFKLYDKLVIDLERNKRSIFIFAQIFHSRCLLTCLRFKMHNTVYECFTYCLFLDFPNFLSVIKNVCWKNKSNLQTMRIIHFNEEFFSKKKLFSL